MKAYDRERESFTSWWEDEFPGVYTGRSEGERAPQTANGREGKPDGQGSTGVVPKFAAEPKVRKVRLRRAKSAPALGDQGDGHDAGRASTASKDPLPNLIDRGAKTSTKRAASLRKGPRPEEALSQNGVGGASLHRKDASDGPDSGSWNIRSGESDAGERRLVARETRQKPSASGSDVRESDSDAREAIRTRRRTTQKAGKPKRTP